jgi:hypothetical protein
LAQNKIGSALARFAPDMECRIGVLAANPSDDATEAPMALVVEIGGKAADGFLTELHRLAWNFSHCPVLITVEPDIVRVWSCCEAPVDDASVERRLVHAVGASDLQVSATGTLEASAARALHWLNLVSGQFWRCMRHASVAMVARTKCCYKTSGKSETSCARPA